MWLGIDLISTVFVVEYAQDIG